MDDEAIDSGKHLLELCSSLSPERKALVAELICVMGRVDGRVRAPSLRERLIALLEMGDEQELDRALREAIESVKAENGLCSFP